MDFLFEKCSKAIEHANVTKSFGVYYSEKQNPDSGIHIHECCEVLLCLSGGKNFLIDDRIYNVENGDLFIINQYEAHKITYDGDGVFARFVLEIHPSFLYQYSSEQTDLSHCFYTRGTGISNQISPTAEETKSLHSLFSSFKADDSYGNDIFNKTVAVRILIYINSLFIAHMQSHSTGDENIAVLRTIDYINKNYSQELSVEILAKNAYVSANQLCRLFKRHCGTTLSKYITSKRITEAKKLLTSGENVTETALQCGFNDYANFIRVFKRCVGVPPGKYRQESK